MYITYSLTPLNYIHCIWIEDGDIEINIEKDIVEIEWNFNGAYEGGSGRMEIDRSKLIELLLKLEDV